MNTVHDLLLTYAFRLAPPQDRIRFQQLVQFQGPLGGLTVVAFLLYRPQNGPSVYEFLFETVPRLLSQLRRTTQPQRIMLHGHTRGRVDWSTTYKARCSMDSNPAIFVCQQTGRHYDHPENQLLKFLLGQIQICIERVPKDFHTWFVWGRIGSGTTGKPFSVNNELAIFAHRVRVFSNSVYLRNVTLPHSISDIHIAAARTSRNELYHHAADLYDLYDRVVERGEWEKWTELLNQTMPFLPPGADRIARSLILNP